MQNSAMEIGDHAKVALLAGRILQTVELAGKYLGEFAQHQIRTTVSVLIQPEYLEMRAALVSALAPYPDARRAVTAALHAIEARSTDPNRLTGPATIEHLPEASYRRHDTQPISLGRDFARALDPVLLARDCGIEPDTIQSNLLTTTARRILLNCSRQWGKSTIAALVALHEALYAAPAMIIVISPSQPQSTELFKKIHDAWTKLPGAPEARQSR